MKLEFINLLISFVISVSYFVLATKVMMLFFEKISSPISHASYVLLLGSLIGFGIMFHDISDIAANAFQFYHSRGSMMTGIYYWIVFSVLAFAASFIIFHLSYQLIKLSTKENEKAELARNNFHVAGLHAVIFILLCLTLSSTFSILANTFVDYPRFPN